MRRILLAFVAGFLATLIFHQGGLALLNATGLTDRAPFGMAPAEPFGVPQTLSLAFWGGLWGIVLALVMGAKVRYGRAMLFGALAPSAVALFVVAPLKGMPVAGGWDPQVIVGALILNGLWGLGTAVFLRLFR
ncbi:MAG: hypothetical protein ACT443_10270 [Gemmatimonadota bacterium]